MEKAKIIEVLETWNFWKRKPSTGIRRTGYINKIKKYARTGQVVTIEGARRSGKSTLMFQYIDELINDGINEKNTLYVNFEDPRFIGELSVKLCEDIYDTYLQYLKPSGNPYIFLDEVQNIEGWEKFVYLLHETKRATVIVSGSTSQLLSSEFGAALTGRHIPLTVYPLSFKEFLCFKGLEVSGELDIISKKAEINRMLMEYLEFGGFPKVVLSDEKREILTAYFEDIIARDVIERNRIKNVEELKTLAKFYLTGISSLVSFGKISRFLKMPLNTVERFSYYLTYPYIIFFVNKFSYSLKEQKVNPRKVYGIDPGLRNVVGFKFSRDLGRLYENTVFMEFLRRREEIYYCKNKKECDFLIKSSGNIELYQVCSDMNNISAKEREIKGLLEAMEEYNVENSIIITQDTEEEISIDGRKINCIPLWKWLLSEGKGKQ